MKCVIVCDFWPNVHTDVASHGVLGHVLPHRIATIYFFSVNFKAAQSLTAQHLCAVAFSNIFVFSNSSCGSSVAAIWTLFSVLFCFILWFYVRQKVSCSFVRRSWRRQWTNSSFSTCGLWNGMDDLLECLTYELRFIAIWRSKDQTAAYSNWQNQM